MGFFLLQLLQMIGITITGFLVSPYIIIFAVFLLTLAASVALRFLAGAREVKRLESNAKSPIFEQFGSALAGVGTIRAFDKTEEYIHRYVGGLGDRLLETVVALIWLANLHGRQDVPKSGRPCRRLLAHLALQSLDGSATLLHRRQLRHRRRRPRRFIQKY